MSNSQYEAILTAHMPYGNKTITEPQNARTGEAIDEKKVNVWASAPRQRLRAILRQLLAVETLEYEDGNWLHINPKLRSEQKQLVLEEALRLIEKFELDR